MKTGSGQGGEAALPAATDEQFLHTVATDNVIDADAELWSTFERFLGIDLVEAWVLVEVTHKPSPVVDEQGTPTGDWELVSSGKWKRDPDVPTPDRVVVVREQLDDEQTA